MTSAALKLPPEISIDAWASMDEDVPGCPELRLDLGALWKEVARLAPAPGDEPAPPKAAAARKAAKKEGRR